MRMRVLCLTLAAVFLGSCAPFMEDVRQSPPNRTALEGQPSFTFVVPAIPEVQGTGKGISPFQCALKYERWGQHTSLRSETGTGKGRGDFYIMLKMTGGDEISTSYVMVIYDVRRETAGSTETIILTPTAVEQKKGIGTRVPEFNPGLALLYLKNATIDMKFETDSQYDPDSVFSNFKRKYATSFKEEKSDDPKARKGTFRASAGADSYTCGIQIWPYKGGSKTTFSVQYKVAGAAVEGDKMDVTERLKSLKESLVAAVNG